jgi:Xaa-Pro aminopeptidase
MTQSNGSHDFSEAEMSRRLATIRALMAADGVDALYLTDPYNVRYASGFKGEPRHLLITQKEAVLYTSFRNESWARAQTRDIEVSTAPMAVADIAGRLGRLGARRVGVERNVTHPAYEKLQAKLQPLEVKVASAVETARMVKSEAEIACLRAAQQMAERAFGEALQEIRPGVTERFISRRIRNRIDQLEEADDFAFVPLVIAGVNAFEVHHQPGLDEVKRGDSLIIDMGVRYRGYNSDMTRTLCLGEPTDEMRGVYETVGAAHRKALARIRAGELNHAVDAAARDPIERAGYGKVFTHGLGHSVGLEVHDPLLGFSRSWDEIVLKSGMVMTVEPGVYLEGKFGVRIEDCVVVTDDGYDSLTAYDRELIVL